MQKKNLSNDLSLLSCLHLAGVGKTIAAKLERLGIHYVQDLLFHLPFRYQDRTKIHPLANLIPGEYAVIEGKIQSVNLPFTGRTKLLCSVADASGKIHLRFFYINPQQRKHLIVGVRVRCFGEVRVGLQGLELVHPEYRIINGNEPLHIEEYLTPLYPATEGLSQLMLRKLTQNALRLLNNEMLLKEILPESCLHQFKFPALKDALLYVHRPPPSAPIDVLMEGNHIAQKRLVFEELLAHRLSLLHLKKTFKQQKAFPFKISHDLIKKFLKTLPFELTDAQKKVLVEIENDLKRPHPMLRLIQGDVGSGKTIVAALAMLHAVENGYQTALLAPTELLAEQHYKKFLKWFSELNLSIYFLTGQMKNSAKKNVLKAIASGECTIVIGTHAIFQKDVIFSKLAFIIVDEQHRFGVQQRVMLREKGICKDYFPHQLMMTATPIPRTLAMSAYADLDFSIIDELPPGRTPITTRVISNSRRDEILARIKEACESGKQVYWVCTLIEESESLQCEAAEKTAQQFAATLSTIKVGLLHGRMKNNEKEIVMAAFKNGAIQLLVATTVVEVGVDVPNASLMIIENAERLGLSQLHQLRGRVGRGVIASHCVLLYQSPLSEFAKKRLAVIRETTDGFKIAEKDLELRGPGEVMGTRQTGSINLKIADLIRDSDLLPKVQQAADQLQNQYPERVELLMRRWLRQGEIYGQV